MWAFRSMWMLIFNFLCSVKSLWTIDDIKILKSVVLKNTNYMHSLRFLNSTRRSSHTLKGMRMYERWLIVHRVIRSRLRFWAWFPFARKRKRMKFLLRCVSFLWSLKLFVLYEKLIFIRPVDCFSILIWFSTEHKGSILFQCLWALCMTQVKSEAPSLPRYFGLKIKADTGERHKRIIELARAVFILNQVKIAL